MKRALVIGIGLGLWAATGRVAVAADGPVRHLGALDGSAAVAVDARHFVAANDEDNTLRVYRRDQGGEPVQEFKLDSFLRSGPKGGEADIEGAARIGDRIYWITSHGRNKSGKEEPSRRRLFATDIVREGEKVRLVPVGRPYALLILDLLADERLKPFGLAESIARAPKDDEGFNIEGLMATREGQLLIGLRSPLVGGKALVVPVLNPDRLVQGERAKLGAPILWDLGGLGIRSFDAWKDGALIVAGPVGGKGAFRLYRWDGGDGAPVVVEAPALRELHPEALVVYPGADSADVQVLSDDSGEPGNAPKGGGKKSPPKWFRSAWIKP